MVAVPVTAVTKQLWVVGGRAVRVPPPGALAESAPRRAARAREADLFFILITPGSEASPPASYFETLAPFAADIYFGSGGGITGGLRETFAALHARIRAGNGDAPVNAVAVVLRGTDVYAARSGRMFGALLQWPTLEVFPTDRRDPLEMNLRPLGVGEAPDIQFTRYTVAPGHALLVADDSLALRSDDELRTALSAENVAGMIERLKGLSGESTHAGVLRFTAPDAPDSTGDIPQPSARAPRSAPAPQTPPRQTAPPAESEPLPPRPRESAAPEPESAAPPPAPVAPFTPDSESISVEPSGTPEPAPAAPPFPAEEAAKLTAPDAAAGEDSGGQNALLAGAGALLSRLRSQAGSTGADAVPDKPRRKGPSPLRKASVKVRRGVRRVARGLLAGLLAIISAITRAFDALIPAPGADGKSGVPTNVAVGMAVLIPFVIVIVVVGLALSEQGKGEFQVALERAENAHANAITLSGGNCENGALRPLWVEVLELAAQAGEYRPNDPDVLVISADARNYLDCFDKVERRDLKLLHEFADDAELVGPIVNGGVDLYTLDRANGRIYRDTLNETGDGLTMRADNPVIYTGQLVPSDNITVGPLIDIEWLTSGGTPHDNVLIALDRQGQLISYSPTYFTRAQQLVIEGRWVNPVAMAVFRSNIYVLDAGADQIWRYVPPAGVRAYPNAPEEYFNGDERPELENAVDFNISEEGAVYILFNDGTVRKYRRNVQALVEEQPFDFREAPEGVPASGVALFLDNDPLSRQLYIVDPQTDAVYETLWGGKFRRGYRPRNLPDAFDRVSGFYADAVVRNNMYVLAGNKLYQFRRNTD